VRALHGEYDVTLVVIGDRDRLRLAGLLNKSPKNRHDDLGS